MTSAHCEDNLQDSWLDLALLWLWENFSYYRGFSIRQPSIWLPSEQVIENSQDKERESVSKMEVPAFYDLISEVTSCHVGQSSLIRNNAWDPPSPQSEGNDYMMSTMNGTSNKNGCLIKKRLFIIGVRWQDIMDLAFDLGF